MLICEKCGNNFAGQIVIEGKRRLIYGRKFCLSCKPLYSKFEKRGGIVFELSEEQFRNIVSTSQSIIEVVRKLGLADSSKSSQRVKRRILELPGLSLLPFIPKSTKPRTDVFKENSYFGSTALRRKILKENLKPYFCVMCGNDGIWQGKKLVLQLDHINGKKIDNRLKNLRFLCPNCHSQTSTFAGRNRKDTIYRDT